MKAVEIVRELTEDDSWIEQDTPSSEETSNIKDLISQYRFINRNGDLGSITLENGYFRLYINGEFFAGKNLNTKEQA